MVSNTLIITKLPKSAEEFVVTSKKLKSLIPEQESIVHWVDLKSFTRVLVVFKTSEACVKAKTLLEGRISAGGFQRSDSRVPVIFYGVNTPIYSDKEESRDEFLQLPDAGKLWFLSPPPSPPVGWEPRLEEEPNKDTHFDLMGLHEALKKHKTVTEGGDEKVAEDDDDDDSTSSQKPPKPNLSVDTNGYATIYHGSGSSSQVTTPTIVVEWDPEDGGGSTELSEGHHRIFPRTEMPLGNI